MSMARVVTIVSQVRRKSQKFQRSSSFRGNVKPIRMTRHAREQAVERGATEQEIRDAVLHGRREPAKHGREMCGYSFNFDRTWQGNSYAMKQVAPVIVEKSQEIVVITVYTFYF